MKQMHHKRTFLIVVTQNNIFFIENFILECISYDNVFYYNDLCCCVLGMPPRPFISNEESQQSNTDTDPENEEEPGVESAPILISQLRLSETRSRSHAQAREHGILGDGFESSLMSRNESITQLFSPRLPTSEVLDASTQSSTDDLRETNILRPTSTSRPTNTPILTNPSRPTINCRPTTIIRLTESFRYTNITRQTDNSEPTYFPKPTDTSSNSETSRPTDIVRNNVTPRPTDPFLVHTDDVRSTSPEEAPRPKGKEALLEGLKEDPMEINFNRPTYPSFACEPERISSFADRPATMTQTPRDLAIAGFFYAGYGDHTKCFFCGGCLRDWDVDDDPWVEHARWFPRCSYLINNMGQRFIDTIQSALSEIQREEQLKEDKDDTKQSEEVSNSYAVSLLKSMGYSENKIAKAIDIIRKNLAKGKHRVSISYILDVLNHSDSENSKHIHSEQSRDEKDHTDCDVKHDDDNGEQTTPKPELMSILAENRDTKRLFLCKVCFDKDVSIVFLPCGHLACCKDCAPQLKTCPICREVVLGTVKIFL